MWLNIHEHDVRMILESLRKRGDLESIRIADHISTEIEIQEGLDKYRKAAGKHSKDGDLEFDGDSVVSKGSDSGAYVMGWKWIHDDELMKE